MSATRWSHLISVLVLTSNSFHCVVLTRNCLNFSKCLLVSTGTSSPLRVSSPIFYYFLSWFLLFYPNHLCSPCFLSSFILFPLLFSPFFSSHLSLFLRLLFIFLYSFLLSSFFVGLRLFLLYPCRLLLLYPCLLF